MSKVTKKQWHDPVTGYKLSAGGILFYDDEGIWVIGERIGSEIEYTDIGGRYNPNDCNIWTTIRRELEEETYGMCDITTSQIKTFISPSGGESTSTPRSGVIYIEGHDQQPVYVCIVTKTPSNITLREDLFSRLRDITISENPDMPSTFYKPVCLKKIRYSELKNDKFRLSFRLKKILTQFYI